MPRGYRTRTRLTREQKRELCDKWNARAPMTRREIAAVLGCGAERVRQIENEAMAKIRRALEVKLSGRRAGQ